MSGLVKKDLLPAFTLIFKTMDGGEKKIVLDSNKLTGDFCEEVALAVADIRAEDCDYTEDKYPMAEGQSYEEWREQCRARLDADFMVRRPGESVKDHVTRTNKPRLNNLEFAHKLLIWYAKRTEQSEQCPTLDEFKKAQWQVVRKHMHEMFCALGEVPITELYPKSRY